MGDDFPHVPFFRISWFDSGYMYARVSRGCCGLAGGCDAPSAVFPSTSLSVDLPQVQFLNKLFMLVAVASGVDGQTVQKTCGDSTGQFLDKLFMLVAMASGVDGQTAEKTRRDSTGAVLGQGDMPVWCFWSSLVVAIPVMVQRPIPMVFHVKTIETPLRSFFRWSMPLLCRSCSLPAVVHDRYSWFWLFGSR